MVLRSFARSNDGDIVESVYLEKDTVNSLELRDGFGSSEAVLEVNRLVDDGQKRANSGLCLEMVEGVR